MKILVANIATAQEHSPAGEFIQSTLGPLTRRNMQLADAAAEFTVRFATEGTRHPGFASCKYLSHLNAEAIYPALAQAQEDGFDGAIIACCGDPFLQPIRQALEIPVVGFGEASFLMAAMVGNKFGVVAAAASIVEATLRRMESYGFTKRLAALEISTETPEQLELGLVDARDTIENFTQVCRKLIVQGADVLVPTCGLTSPALRLAPGAEQYYPHGLTQVDGVPVIDVMSAAVNMLTALVMARRAGSGWRARKVLEGPHELKASLPGVQFWDC